MPINKPLLCLLGILTAFQIRAQVISDTLFINMGNITLDSIQQLSIPFIAFNQGNLYRAKNDFIKILPSQTLLLTIKNNDSVNHTILFNKGQLSTGSIAPGADYQLTIPPSSPGIYELCDSNETNRFLGLSSYLIRHPLKSKEFYWHLNEHQSTLNLKLRQGEVFDADTFQPDYFTINENSHPKIMEDSLATVKGNVGDSIYIFVFNSGKMTHSVHFHGYHVIITYSDKNPSEVGREKDSIPLSPRSGQIYLLVPFQHGSYPVHDHNLIATTGGGNYPNGMMVMMKILP